MSKVTILAAVLALTAQQDSIRWLNDYKQASFEAKQTGKPMFVVFR
jgi:hypothetical protein